MVVTDVSGHKLFVPLKMGPISCPEISTTNYEYTLCNILEERRPHIPAET